MFIKPKIRTSDSYGSGFYGASRGERTHKGIDLCCEPNSIIYSSLNGKVTKLGYPYTNDLSFRYVQITDIRGIDFRFFYVLPNVEIGDLISIGDPIGTSQELGVRYPVTDRRDIPIKEHVHFEVVIVKDGEKEYLDPNLFLN